MKRDSVARTISWTLMMGREVLSTASTCTPALDASVLLGEVLGLTRTELLVHGDDCVSDEKYLHFKELLNMRQQGMPVAYLTKRREFMSLTFSLDRSCLIPRPETELLVEKVVEAVLRKGIENPHILEFGTGTGCISVVLARELARSTIVATDISPGALKVAEGNAQRHQVNERIEFRLGDLYEPLSAGERLFDVLVSNPPYIAEDEIDELPVGVREYEPPGALWTGEKGLEISRRIIAGAGEHLAPQGIIALEINPRRGRDIVLLLQAHGFDEIETYRDLAGFERVILAERKV